MAVRIYEILEGCRDFGMKDQMTRAAVSISSNIAEGSERNSVKEFIRFLHISKGFSAELRTQTYIARHINLIEEKDQTEIVEELKSISKMLQNLIKVLAQIA